MFSKERGSLLRVFRKEFHHHVHRLTSNAQSKLSAENTCQLAARYDVKGAAELVEDLLKCPMESVGFGDLSRLWECALEEAERYFEIVKVEAQREFSTGHLAAKVFEPVDWLRSVWGRAQFLPIRDTFLVE
jgi:hypothetical protein